MTSPPSHEIVRVDPRLLSITTTLFFATFPHRRLAAGSVDPDGRAPLLTDPPFGPSERTRWLASLDLLLTQPSSRGALLREVTDRSGRRLELLLATAPSAYRSGATLVGPFADADAADAWAAATLAPPWVHDVITHEGAVHVDVFVGDPDAP